MDLGANIGLATVWFLNHFSHAQVVAVEANPDNYPSLSTNLDPYGKRVQVVQGAVWSKCTDLTVARRSCASDGQVRESLPGDKPEDRIKAWDIPHLMDVGKMEQIDLLK